MDKQKDFCTTKCRSLFYFQAAARADGAGRVLFFWSNGYALRAGQRQGWFFLLVKWLALRAGQRQGWFFFELVLALVARGWFFLLVKRLALRAGQR